MKNTIQNGLVLCFILSFFFAQHTSAQTALGLGDIAFVSINVDDSTSSIKDPFQIIFLKAITAGTQISFTDRQYRDCCGFSAGSNTETVFTWRATSSYAVGDIIMFWGSGGSSPYIANAESGTIDAGNAISMPASQDQIFAFQGSAINYDSLIAGIHTNVDGANTTDANWDNTSSTSNNYSDLPDILTNGVNAVRLHDGTSELDNWGYDCSTTSGSAATLRSAINNDANWTGDQSLLYTYKCVSAPTSTTWTGSWSNGAPTSTIDAIIASNTTPGAFTCKDLTINSSFDLTLANGVTATIHGDVTNSGNGTAGTGTLAFAGTAQALNGTAFSHAGVIEINTGSTLTTNGKLTLSNHASLMHGTGTPNGGGSISGSVTFEKTIGSTTDGWRSFALPVDDLIENFETGLNTRCSNSSPAGRQNTYYWDGTDAGSNTATGWVVANNTTDDENKGYAIYLSNNSDNFFDFSSTVSISGTPNDGTKTFNLDYTYDPESSKSQTSERGWNLIPNYFPSNLGVYNLINDADFDPAYKAVHIWNQGSSQMQAINQSGLVSYNTGSSVFSTTRQIPAFMSFWVKATNNSQSVQLKNYMRTGSSDSLPANTYFKTNPDIFRIEIKDQKGYGDQFSTAFIAGATDNFDNQYDIYKFKSFSDEVPTLYTKDANGELISLAALPIKESHSLPIYLESEKDKQQYTIKAITQEYSHHYTIELVDNKTGIKTNLLEEDYTLNFDKSYTNPRLTLNFNKKASTTIEELKNQEKSYAYTQANGINIVYQNNNTAALSTITIYNTLGQQLYQANKVVANQKISYTPTRNNSVSQIYIIKVETDTQSKTLRVVY